MLESLREEREAKLQMLLSLRKNALTSLFKEVRVFKDIGYRSDSIAISRDMGPLRTQTEA